MEDERPIEDILDTIGDQEARRVLAGVSQNPRSAKELSEDLDLSLPTIYRRLQMLQDHELVVSQMTYDEDGNHYKTWECNFDATVISLDDDQYNIRIYRRENLPSRFTNLWDELSQ